MKPVPFKLSDKPIHLGLGARAAVESPITGIEWYESYIQRRESDGIEGRLVAEHSFDADWDSWEMHPEGCEVVYCISGRMELIQELDGDMVTIELGPGEYAINEPGVWHTANVREPGTVLFITAGLGTQHRRR